jgi:hypothetical protein
LEEVPDQEHNASPPPAQTSLLQVTIEPPSHQRASCDLKQPKEVESDLNLKEEEAYERNARERAEKNRFLNFFFKMVTASWFNFIIFILIIANTVVLASDGHY